MSVGNIGSRNFGVEQVCNFSYRFILVDHPYGMTYIIFRSKIIYRVVGRFPVLHQGIDGFNTSVGQEYVAGLRTGIGNMVDPVFLFFRSGILMFFDQVVVIVL